jgi:hypothetical protein
MVCSRTTLCGTGRASNDPGWTGDVSAVTAYPAAIHFAKPSVEQRHPAALPEVIEREPRAGGEQRVDAVDHDPPGRIHAGGAEEWN